MNRQHRKWRFGHVGILLVMIPTAIIICWPVIWMILSSFKNSTELWGDPLRILARNPTIDGYLVVFRRMAFLRYFLNSVIVSGSASLIVLFTSSLGGYAFAKLRFRGRNLLFLLVLASIMIPMQVLLVPVYMIVRWLKLLDTYLALILIQGFSVLGIFLVRQFLHSLPIDYIDAARIDGLNEFGIYYKIVLPLITPVLSALAIFSFRDSWGNLLWPVLTITSTEKYTLPVGIASLTTVLGPVMHLLLPAASTSVIPVMIVFFFFQSKIIEAVTSTGLKG